MVLSRARFVAAPLLVALVVFAGNARAGALQIRDEARVLAPDDAARLRSVVASAPFDARFVVTADFPDEQDLSRYVRSLFSEPNQVVVGVDPKHHHVQVHFGTGSRVPQASWSSIERAGNDAFRRGDWEGGAAAIFNEAARAAASAPGGAPLASGARENPSLMGPGTVVLIIAGILGIGLLVSFLRRRSVAPFVGPGGPGYGGPPYPGGYGYGGVPPQGGGMGPLGGGLLGAGLGGVAGYELGKAAGEREREIGPRGDNQGGNFDSGDRGGFDSGGGGSDWDDGGGGGGGDGGGGDGGGGGSDF
jgi:hypothetical protein